MANAGLYRKFLERGSERLNTGRHAAALYSFLAAARTAGEHEHPPQWAKAMAKAGIAYRLLGHSDKALVAFTSALAVLRTHGDKRALGRTLSDTAMLYISHNKRDDLATATDLLAEALAVQLEAADCPITDLLATWGFMKRVAHLRAEDDQSREQVSLHQLAISVACLVAGSPLYSLNSLVWALKGLPSEWRIPAGIAGAVLSLQQKNPRRLIEIALLTIGDEALLKEFEKLRR